MIGRVNRRTSRKRAPVLLCPPQIPGTGIKLGPPRWETGDNRLSYGTATEVQHMHSLIAVCHVPVARCSENAKNCGKTALDIKLMKDLRFSRL
jgi:hypothetical protein